MTDLKDVYAWTSYTDTFDIDGVRTSRSTVYDDWREAKNTYVDEVLASSFTIDVADQFVWNTVEKVYDAAGVLTEQTNAYDNGRLLETLSDDVVRSTAKV